MARQPVKLADMLGPLATEPASKPARARKPAVEQAPRAAVGPTESAVQQPAERAEVETAGKPAASRARKSASKPASVPGVPAWNAGVVPPERPAPLYRRPRRRLGEVEPEPKKRGRPAKKPLPKWKTLDKPKSYLAWPAAASELDKLAQLLDRLRPPGEGERITSNTLLRIASGWLLEVGAPYLKGITEDELAESLGLAHYPDGRDKGES